MKTNNMLMIAMMSIFCLSSMNSNAYAAETESQVVSESCSESGRGNSYYVNVDKYESVSANTTDVYNKVFYAGESVVVYVNGDGDTDLDLYIYDENGNLIDSDTDSTDTCVCSFTPRWKGNFKIKVKNRGNVFNRYHLRIVQ